MMVNREGLLQQPGQGSSYWMLGDLYTYKEIGEQTDKAYALCEIVMQPHSEVPPHIHKLEDEAFYIQEGEVEFQLDEQIIIATAGTFLHSPKSQLHRFKNIGSKPAKLLSWVTPSGLNPNLNVHYRYSRPIPEDEGDYHSVGYVDTALIKELVGQEAEFFMCGSPPFMQSLMAGLKEWGVPDSRVFFESFGKPMKVSSEKQPSAEQTNGKVEEAEIVFADSGKTLTWREGDGTILEFAEANNIDPPYSCRAGICGTCMCKISEGEVDYQETPTTSIDEGSVLICISQPRTSKVVLDL